MTRSAGEMQLERSALLTRHRVRRVRESATPMATTRDFRRIALALTDTVESAHMGHPDFRVRGRIFATLHADGWFGMVKLSPEQQRQMMRDRPDVFSPENGAWGLQGSTRVRLEAADDEILGDALTRAWRNVVEKERAAPARARRRRDGTKKSRGGR